MNQRRSTAVGCACGLLFCVAAPLQAADFFSVTATGTNGATVTEGGSNLVNLTNDLIGSHGAFKSIAGQGFSGSLTYGGVKNALLFSENAAQTSATLTIPGTGFTKTFTGTNSSSLETQIRDFLKSDGADQYAKFLKTINEESTSAAIDGNPQASTAIIANAAYRDFGLNPVVAPVPRTPDNSRIFSIEGDGGVTRSGGFNGDYAVLSILSGWRFTDPVALTLSTTLEYRAVAGSEVYTVAEELGLPISIIEGRGNGLTWQVTPWGFGGVAASYDQVSGGILVGGGLTSSLALHVNDLTFTLADQGSYMTHVAARIADYRFDVDVDQWIIKNGGEVAYRPGHGPISIEAGGAYSDFLHRAAVPDYWTATGGLALHLGHHSMLRVEYIGDFAHHGYSSNGGAVVFSTAY
jgi:hypothetical protein